MGDPLSPLIERVSSPGIWMACGIQNSRGTSPVFTIPSPPHHKKGEEEREIIPLQGGRVGERPVPVLGITETRWFAFAFPSFPHFSPRFLSFSCTYLSSSFWFWVKGGGELERCSAAYLS
eukprot:RCo054251